MNSDSEIRRLARIIATAVAKGFCSGRRAAGVRNESDAIFLIRTWRQATCVSSIRTRVESIVPHAPVIMCEVDHTCAPQELYRPVHLSPLCLLPGDGRMCEHTLRSSNGIVLRSAAVGMMQQRIADFSILVFDCCQSHSQKNEAQFKVGAFRAFTITK
jgi:hypothetical protein